MNGQFLFCGVILMAISERMARFVDEYLLDPELNAFQAAKRAGYKSGDRGAELLRKTEIKELIEAKQADRSLRTGVSQDMVVAELVKIAFSNLKDFVTWTQSGRIGFRPMDMVDGAVLSEISESITKNGRTKKIKLHDKLKALELLGKHLGMFKDDSNINVNIGVQIVDDIR